MAKKKRKRIKPKIDDYYNDGAFEMIQSGKHVYMRSLLSPKEIEQVKNTAIDNFSEKKEEIDGFIDEIIQKVLALPPERLLMMAHELESIPSFDDDQEGILIFKPSESPTRPAEYIQSILASNPCMHIEDISPDDFIKKGYEVLADIEELHSKIRDYYFCWGFVLSDSIEDSDLVKFILEAQSLYFVRGERYQVLQVEYFERLLPIHNAEFQKLFGLSSADILDGVKSLEYALSQGRFDSYNELAALFDQMESDCPSDWEAYAKHNSDSFSKATMRAFSESFYKVTEITQWPVQLIKELSFEMGEATWYKKGDYSSWPVVYLPSKSRPFICLGDQYYCFDYYSLMDNFYRVMQKTITRLDSAYSNQWAINQQHASEKMVRDIFADLLPGCTSYNENYYPDLRNRKNQCENDLIIQYEDVLIFVEVKAGSFSYDAPLSNYESHVSSYRALIEKADHQCARMHEYFLSCSESMPLYDEKKNQKAAIDLKNVSDVFMVSVTMDNINDFAARAEKLSFLNLKCDAISISIDDLMTYREYFDSPLFFMHFLNQRRAASQQPMLVLNDELDHLGMYIEHNCYAMQLEDYHNSGIPNWVGYREKLDTYFMQLSHPELALEKPRQEIDPGFMSIIEFIDHSNIPNRVRLSDYLLNFSSKTREHFSSQIERLLQVQLQKGTMSIFNTAGIGDSLRFTCFVNQLNLLGFSEIEKTEHVLGQIIQNDEECRALLDFYYDASNSLTNIKFHLYQKDDIPENDLDRLRTIGKSIAITRMNEHAVSHGKKVGRNDPCPCGSGKKYKKCHGS
ncbi:MAG: SEC-C domain-containing protein [Coriobacteriales bacterium]|jgi:hypothetical protein|nr:SEC-C domain-containing protein [Coriobacteriales bacterium]